MDIYKYKIPLTSFFKDVLEQDISKVGLTNYIEKKYQILDCEHNSKKSYRLRQTIDHTYKVEMTLAIEAINLLDDEQLKEAKLKKLEELHNANLEYEKINPPIIYKKAKTTTKRKVKSKENKTKTDLSDFKPFINLKQKLKLKL